VHFYTVLGVLLALSGFGCAAAGALAKEPSNQKMGVFMAVLLVIAATACFGLQMQVSGS
jgi:hypothetical protein